MNSTDRVSNQSLYTTCVLPVIMIRNLVLFTVAPKLKSKSFSIISSKNSKILFHADPSSDPHAGTHLGDSFYVMERLAGILPRKLTANIY